MSSTTFLRPLFRGLTLAVVALVAACGGDSGGPSEPNVPTVPTVPNQPQEPGPVSGLEGKAIFGLTCANELVLFGSENPDVLQRQVTITGMPAGAVMLGIEFKGFELYGVGSDSKMYALDTLTGAATAKSNHFSVPADGLHFGMAYDAVRNLFHLSSAEEDLGLVIDGSTNDVVSTVTLAYAAGDEYEGTNPAVVAEAYYGPAIFGIESNANTLVKVSQATGAVQTVATLPFNVYICSGIDIDTDGTAYAALATDNGSELYTIDILTGETDYQGWIAGSPVHSIALRP